MERNLERYARDYTLDYGFERHQVSFRRRSVLKRCAATRADDVLEIGCGLEPLFLDHPPVNSWHVVEPAAMFAAKARLGARAHPQVVVVEGFLESSLSRLAEAHALRPFGLIIASGVLQEVADPGPFLAAIRSLCGPDTAVQIDVSNARSLHRLTAVAMGLLEDPAALSERGRMLQQRAVYDRDSLFAEVTRAGFAVKAEGGIFLKPFDHARMEKALTAGVLDEAHLRAYEELGERFPALASEVWMELRRRDGREGPTGA